MKDIRKLYLMKIKMGYDHHHLINITIIGSIKLSVVTRLNPLYTQNNLSLSWPVMLLIRATNINYLVMIVVDSSNFGHGCKCWLSRFVIVDLIFNCFTLVNVAKDTWENIFHSSSTFSKWLAKLSPMTFKFLERKK